HGVDANVGLGTARPRVNVLDYDAIARVALAALGDLGPEDRPLQGLHLAPNAHGTQVSEDALAHIEVGWKGHVPFEVKAVGEAGLRQELFRLLRVVLWHRQVLPISAQRVADFRADPVAPGDADALRLLACQELPINGETDGLAHALVVEGAIGLVIAGE